MKYKIKEWVWRNLGWKTKARKQYEAAARRVEMEIALDILVADLTGGN